MNKYTIDKNGKKMTSIKGEVMITEESYKKGVASINRIFNDGSTFKGVMQLPAIEGTIVDSYGYYASTKKIEYAPLVVKNQINIGYATLSSLENCPQSCESINLTSIKTLKSLIGISKIVDSELNITECNDLETLNGSPDEVQYFILNKNSKLTSLKFAPIADVYRILKCPGIPDEEIDLSKNDKELFHKWLKSGEDFKDFMYKKRGITLGKKFGF